MKVLSLFDGMACGMLAMIGAGVPVDRYVAYEIDKYAVQTSSHNFPMIEHRGDVFAADFTEFQGFDWLVGGESLHLLEHSTEEQSRDRGKRTRMGAFLTVCESIARGKADVLYL